MLSHHSPLISPPIGWSAPNMLYWIDSAKGEQLDQPSHSHNVAQKTLPVLDLAALSERHVSPLYSPWVQSDFSDFFG